MKPHDTEQGPKDPMQGEGDRISARHYNEEATEFAAEGKVEPAAKEAARYVETQPEDARRAEQAARKGPRSRVSVDELVAKGRTVVDRVRPAIDRVVGRVRKRFARAAGPKS